MINFSLLTLHRQVQKDSMYDHVFHQDEDYDMRLQRDDRRHQKGRGLDIHGEVQTQTNAISRNVIFFLHEILFSLRVHFSPLLSLKMSVINQTNIKQSQCNMLDSGIKKYARIYNVH